MDTKWTHRGPNLFVGLFWTQIGLCAQNNPLTPMNIITDAKQLRKIALFAQLDAGRLKRLEFAS